MALSRKQVEMSYELMLGRKASPSEVDKMQANLDSVGAMRQVFLNSPEFRTGFERMVAQGRAALPTTLIHLHIPKTAGTTMTATLAQIAPAGTAITVGDHDLHRLMNLTREERGRLRFVFGHLSWGVASILPQQSRYICVLRRPGARILSYFHYIRRTSSHSLSPTLNENNHDFGRFLEFVDANPEHRLEVDNGQMRRLAGPMLLAQLGQEDILFRRALGNIFAPDMQYGLTEHFHDFLARLVECGVIQQFDNSRENSAPEPLDLQAELAVLTPRQRDLYNRYTVWDDKFYEICHRAYFAASDLGTQA